MSKGIKIVKIGDGTIKIIQEGIVKKGGVNPAPSMPRPSIPTGQGGKINTTSTSTTTATIKKDK